MKNTETKKTLVIGIGNTGRRDDGLGWRFLDLLNGLPDFMGDLEYRYQLQIEDAALVSTYDEVIFVDATQEELDSGYALHQLEKKPFSSYTSHAIPPSHILSLCSDLYNKDPKAYLLAIRGYEWGLMLGLSDRAEENMRKAYDDFVINFTHLKTILNPSNLQMG